MLDRRTLLTAGAAGAALPLLTHSPAHAAPTLGATLASGLQIPWGLDFLPSGDALVTERTKRRVFRVSRNGGKTLVGEVTEAEPNGEGGLLGLALDPDFATNRFVYFYVTTATDNRILRAEYDGGVLSSRTVILPGIPKGAVRHNGGRLGFGPDGMLYATTGDTDHDVLGQGAGSWAQDTGNYAGKILRMTPTGGVPADNPFGPSNHVWTYGHRNVQGLAWDARGRMWATELGEGTRDELNRIVAGHNYGWPIVEGGDGDGPFHDPFVVWSPTSVCSPSGMTVANGLAWVGALNGDCLWSVRLGGANAGRQVRHFHNHPRLGRIRTVERAPDGSLWVATSNSQGTAAVDGVIRIRL